MAARPLGNSLVYGPYETLEDEAELNENLDLSLAGVGMVGDDNVVREFRLTHLIATMKEVEP